MLFPFAEICGNKQNNSVTRSSIFNVPCKSQDFSALFNGSCSLQHPLSHQRIAEAENWKLKAERTRPSFGRWEIVPLHCFRRQTPLIPSRPNFLTRRFDWQRVQSAVSFGCRMPALLVFCNDFRIILFMFNFTFNFISMTWLMLPLSAKLPSKGLQHIRFFFREMFSSHVNA